MTRVEALELLDAIVELKKLKADLMGWSNWDGYFLDSQIEAYLRGRIDAKNTDRVNV